MIEAQLRQEIDALETKLAELEGTTRLLLTARLLVDGHAKTWTEASRIARDIDRVKAIYEITDDEIKDAT